MSYLCAAYRSATAQHAVNSKNLIMYHQDTGDTIKTGGV